MPRTRVQATVTFSTDANGAVIAEVTSGDSLARNSLILALREFWALDAQEYDGSNEAKWRARLGQ